MTTGRTTNLDLALPVEGELDGTWGDEVNNGITDYVDIAIAGTLTLNGDGAVTLANTLGSAAGDNIGATTAQYAIIKVTGTSTAKTITGPSSSKTYVVVNASSYSVTFKAAAQTGVTIVAGERAHVVYNGTDYVKVATSLGTGDVVGPASATDNAVPTFDGATGKLIKNNSGVTVSGGVVTATGFSGPINGTVGATTPNTVVATQVNVVGQGPVRFEDTAGGQYVGLRAPGTVASSYTLTLPTADGTSGQALVTDGAGNLAFGSAGISTGKAIAMAMIFGF